MQRVNGIEQAKILPVAIRFVTDARSVGQGGREPRMDFEALRPAWSSRRRSPLSPRIQITCSTLARSPRKPAMGSGTEIRVLIEAYESADSWSLF
jgi:hypothetical protein